MLRIDYNITCNTPIYFFPESLLIKKMTNAIIPTTTNIPTHTPALKISPTNSQLVKEIEIIANNKT